MAFSLLSPLNSPETAQQYADSLALRAQRWISKKIRSDDFSVPVGVLGGGLMGTAIAATHLKNGGKVVLCDPSENVLQQLPQRLASELTLQGETGSPEIGNTVQIVEKNVKLTHNPDSLVACEILIETVPEKLKLKQKLYKKLEELRFGGLLFSNTSTINISRLAEKLERPERFCGFHFFHPVRERSLLEIVRGRQSSEETISVAQRYALFLQKTPITVEDGAGFLVNRLLNPLLRESLALFDAGVPLERIESVARQVGMHMGPFRMIDEIGLDVTLHAGWVLNNAFPESAYVSESLLKLIEIGRLGRKTQAGFLRYPSDVSWKDEGTIDDQLERLLPKLPEIGPDVTDEEIAQRLFLPMIREAFRILEQGIVREPWQIDLAVVLGLGFPRSRGGLCYWAEQIRLSHTMQRDVFEQQPRT